MTRDRALLIATDRDGRLLNHADYNYQATFPAIAALRKRQIPLIPVTSKTWAEVAALRRALPLTSPFVVEKGGAIFLAASDERFALGSLNRNPEATATPRRAPACKPSAALSAFPCTASAISEACRSSDSRAESRSPQL